MLRTAGRCAALVSVLLAGCVVESTDELPNTPPDMIGRVCTMQMTVTGSFSETSPAPPNEDGTAYQGCWPVGVWTFQAQRGETDCDVPPMLLSQYQFKVEEKIDSDGEPYQSNTYMTDPSARVRVKVSQGGDGLCEGELNLFSADGKEVWIIKPELYADKHLGGDGEYALHKTDQWIGDN
jgi:hypothetical protein